MSRIATHCIREDNTDPDIKDSNQVKECGKVWSGRTEKVPVVGIAANAGSAAKFKDS